MLKNPGILKWLPKSDQKHLAPYGLEKDTKKLHLYFSKNVASSLPAWLCNNGVKEINEKVC